VKVTDPDVIRAGEKDLIEAVKDDLDWDVVKEIVKKRINLGALESKGGEIVVYNSQIAFRVDLGLQLNVSLMFDRDGTYIPESGDSVDSIEAPEKAPAQEPEPEESTLDTPVDEAPEFNPEELSLSDDVSGEPLETMDDELELGELSVNDDELDLDELSADDTELGLGEPSVEDELDLGELPDDDNELDLDDLSADDTELDLGELSLSDEGTEDSMDDDIDDILKESRDFWEQKKED